MPPNYVKAYVKRNKHDVADAEAICEAVRRPSMRFVPVKTAEQQSALMMHRARDLLIRQRTMLVNALRGHLAEFGLIEAQGLHKVAKLIAIVMDESGWACTGYCPSGAEDDRQPDRGYPDTGRWARDAGSRMAQEQPGSRRLATMPGIGPIIATAIAATVCSPNIFRSGREFAAWLGLVPRQNSTGGKARLGGISKRGDSCFPSPARQQRTHGAALFEASQDRPLVNVFARVENHVLSRQSPWPTRRRAWLRLS